MNDSESNGEENEDLDINYLLDVMKNDGRNFVNYVLLSKEQFNEMLIKTNDHAVMDMQAGNFNESLASLERMEKTLEVLFGSINPNEFVVCCNKQKDYR